MLPEEENILKRKGVAYLYQDVHTGGRWTPSPFSINSSTSAVARTVTPLYEAIAQQVSVRSAFPALFFVFRATSTMRCTMTIIQATKRTHIERTRKACKCSPRVRAFGSFTGKRTFHYFAKLVHCSVPGFVSNASYVYPRSGIRYGQSMLCVTFSANQLGNLG